MKFLQYFIFVFVFGCIPQTAILDSGTQTDVVEVKKLDDTSFQATLKSDNKSDQSVDMSQVIGQENASVTFPAGSLAIEQNIRFEKGESLASQTLLNDLGVSDTSDISEGSSSLLVSTDAGVNPAGTLQIALPLKLEAGLNAGQFVYVFFKVIDYETGKVKIGSINSSNYVVDSVKSTVLFSTKFYGVFQLVRFYSKPNLPKENVESSSNILNSAGSTPDIITKTIAEKNPEGIITSTTEKETSESTSSGLSTPILKSFTLHQVLTDHVMNIHEHRMNDKMFADLKADREVDFYFKIVESSLFCEKEINYESVIPTLNTPVVDKESKYKVCIQMQDKEKRIGYHGSDAFETRYTVPIVGSILLVNDASDKVLNLHELNVDLPVVSVQSSLQILQYAILDPALTCSSSNSYTTIIPTASKFSILDHYKICVKGIDNFGNFAFIQSAQIDIFKSPPSIVSGTQNITINPGVGKNKIYFPQATDDTAVEFLQYRICRSSSNNIVTIKDMESANCHVVHDFDTYANLGNGFVYDEAIQPQVTYFYNILVKDIHNNKSIYLSQSVKTAAIHLSYVSANKLEYAVGIPGSWNFESIGPSPSASIIYHDLKLDNLNKPHLAWLFNNQINYLNRTSGSWPAISDTVDYVSVTNWGTKLAIDGLGKAHVIAHNDHPASYFNNIDGSLSSANQFDASTQGNHEIIIDKTNEVEIYSLGQYNIERHTSPSTWNVSVVHTVSPAATLFQTDSSINSNRNVFLCANTGVNKELYFASNKGGVWGGEVLFNFGANSLYCKIAVHPSTNQVHILAKDYISGYIYYFYSVDGTWNSNTKVPNLIITDAAANNISFDIEVDKLGKAFAVYQNKLGKLNIIHNVNGGWSAPVSVKSSVGMNVHIEIDK